MFHRQARNRIAKKPAHARSLERNIVTSLVLYETIRITKQRARVVQPLLDRLIAQAKRNEPHNAVRTLNAVFTDKNASRKVMEVLLKRYDKRASGFSRAIPVGSRKGDGASMVDLELVDKQTEVAVSEEPKAEKKPAAKKKASSPKK